MNYANCSVCGNYHEMPCDGEIKRLTKVLEAARDVRLWTGYGGKDDCATGVEDLEDALKEYDLVQTRIK